MVDIFSQEQAMLLFFSTRKCAKETRKCAKLLFHIYFFFILSRTFSRSLFPLPKPNNFAMDNIALRTALSLPPLFIKFPLVANEAAKRALMPLFFGG
jgi:hypothetical protein